MVAIEVPPGYGWVVLTVGFGTSLTNFLLSGPVVKGRKELDVPMPNAYATPGYHKNADEFNRAQRSHQNYLEYVSTYSVTALLGGLKYPITNAIGGALFCIGSLLYQKGYMDKSLDVKTARYQKGGAIKFIGQIIGLVSTCAFAYDLIKSD